MNIEAHPIYKAIYDLCREIEKLPASELATRLVVMASDLEKPADLLRAELDRTNLAAQAVMAENEKLRGEVERLREAQMLWDDLSEWSQQTFGTDLERGPIGPLKHLKLECDEAIASPFDRSEFADCLILVMDATRRAGFTWDQLMTAAKEKHLRNKLRRYPMPTGDEPSQHIKALNPTEAK